MSLTRQAVSGVKWSTVSKIGRQGAQLLTTVILVRFLTPSDFGLVGMAIVVIGFVGIFKGLGTSAAIIQKKEPSEELLSSIFWVNVGFGILVMLILYFSAPLAGLFYKEPRVIPVLQVLSLSFFISGLSVLQQALLERALAFQTLAKVELSAVISGSVVGVGLALLDAGIWSLVFQLLTTVTVTTILLWVFSSWKVAWNFHWNEVKSVGNYSLNLLGYNIFNYLARNVDYLLIGRYLGAQDLGYYTLAYQILLFPLQSISGVISRVMFPVYSGLQSDNSRFAKAYLKVGVTIALITFPMMAGVLVLAKPFVLTVFGVEWQSVIPLIMILAPVGMIQSIGSTVGSIYQAKGRTDWMFWWGVSAGTMTLIAFIIGLRWGIVGVATAYAIVSFVLIYPGFAIPFQLIDLNFVHFLKTFQHPFYSSMAILVVLIVFELTLAEILVDPLELAVGIVLGSVVYMVLNWMTNREQLQELWNLSGLKRSKVI